MTRERSGPPGSGLDLHLDWSGRPDSHALAEALRAAIRDGRLAAGSRVPSTRALAHDLGVARGTVTRAYAQLGTEGFLLSRQGAPTTVADRLRSGERADPPAPRPEPRSPRWDFRPGRPNLSAFPRKDWLAASRRVLRSMPADDLDYGDPQGPPALREALAEYLRRARAVHTSPERLIVCNGYSEALSLISRALRANGVRSVDFEDPSLPHFRTIVEDDGMRVHGIPVDDDGIDVGALRSPAAVVTPAHQFPLGVTMRAQRRAALIRSAKTEGRIIVEDDYDGEFRFDRKPVGSLQGMAPEAVIYAGTASKTLAPALRIAWLALPARLVEPVRAMRTHGRYGPVFDQLALAELLRSGAYDQHVRRSRAAYRQRREQLLRGLDGLRSRHRRYPAGISAGLHLTLRLDPDGPDEREVLARARSRGVALETLGPWWVNPGDHPPGVVIGYAAPAEHAFRPALAALLDTLDP
ncbi:PLP-dependent aminotransferase family protein [Saccharopolyspora sp. MS10]|uniref:MocR-like pyridoxine biosynthesis transcription factor PdxR n=1 Tax=Saccharopolyspora sp. MS10 TaxID=3385973 RepID=UPI0039A3B27B